MSEVKRTTRITLSDTDIQEAIFAWVKSKNLVGVAKWQTAHVQMVVVPRTTGRVMAEHTTYEVQVTFVVDG